MRRGFSLLELLLVIFIISLVYFLGFDTLEKPEARKVVVSAKNFKTALQHSLAGKAGTFLCTNHCKTCYFKAFKDSAFKPFSGKLAIAGATTYYIDDNGNINAVDYGRYKDETICLMMHFYANGSSSPLILKKDNKIYTIPSYLGNSKTFTSLNEAKESLLKTSEILSRGGEIY